MPELRTLLDLSTLPKLGVKGPGAETWLRERGIDVPPSTYDTRPLADGGLIVRLGTSDFFLEGAASGDALLRLHEELASGKPGVYHVERHDATILLGGPTALKVLAQVCSFDFRSAPPGRVILTRSGGVNCMVLPEAVAEGAQFRMWVDCTYAAFFWETLNQIVKDVGGFARTSSTVAH